MKPLFLEIQAFGPYVEKQAVDFEKLGEKGIFLIKGNTGSGKTTIFDAMTFALYGGGTGDNDKSKIGRNDLEEWRCTQADAETDTIVSFTFSVRTHKYIFTRSLTQKRVNLSAKYEAGEIDEEGNMIPFFNNPKKDDLTRKAVELIGLTKEQFRQVVLLPQGQFERFLTAPSSEKEDILQKIFGSEQWSKYSEAFYAKASERKNLLDEEIREINSALKEEELGSLEELKERIDFLAISRKELDIKHESFDGEKKRKELTYDIKLKEQFESLHAIEKSLAVLEKEKDEIESKRQFYSEALKAEKVRTPISDYETAEKKKTERNDALVRLEQNLPKVQEKKERAQQQKAEHQENSPVEGLNRQIGLYRSKEDTYNSIDSLYKAMNDAKKKLKVSKSDLGDAQTALETAKGAAKEEKEKFDCADRIAKEYRDRYYAGIYGEIAAGLIEGEKCPVCGSTSHPNPAEKLPSSVSKTELDQKEKNVEETKKIWNSTEENRVHLENLYNEKNTAFVNDNSAFTRAETEYNNASDNLIDGIPDTKALKKAIKECDAKIAEYVEKEKQLEKFFTDASNELASLEERIKNAAKEQKTASEELEKAGDLLAKSLSANGFEDYRYAKEKLLSEEERSELHRTIVEYDTSVFNNTDSLKKKREELKEKAEPDASKFEERESEIRNELSSYNTESTEIKTSVQRLSKKLSALKSKQADYDANIHQAENDLAFAKKLRGDNGMGLQRYVLAIMFNQVIAEANRMLLKVHSGRYHLFRSDERGNGSKRGLELKVHDNRSPEREGRSVGMLSGGEKFLVSLALSIGMSTVAQKSGIQIEALFIDEGFGTLDDSSIHDAMDVLDSVRKGTGTIGIISHVQLLESNIPTHLEVIKKESGSIITVN